MKWVNSTALKLLFASILLPLKLQSNKCLLYKLRMKGGMSERGLGWDTAFCANQEFNRDLSHGPEAKHSPCQRKQVRVDDPSGPFKM